jgi:molecular chaperone DnaJ
VTPETKDYYAILGVSRDADAGRIKKAFRAKARECHPDASDAHDAEEQFKELNEAYEVLSDPEKRQVYDTYGTVDPRMAGAGFEDVFSGGVEDLFSMFFGAAAAGGRGARVRLEGRDMTASVTVTLQEAATGVEREIKYPRLGTCTTCSGGGAAEGGTAVTCPECGGTGEVQSTRRSFFGTIQTSGPCQRCGMTGVIIDRPCPTCGGEGRTRVTETATVEVPIGARDGATLRVRGLGEAGVRGATAGDLVVGVRVAPHSTLFRDGDDLHVRAHVSITQASLGATVGVAGLTGPETLQVPPGTHEGDVVRVKRAGMPRTGSSVRGDLLVHMAVDVPRKLDKKQRKLLEELAGTLGDGKAEAAVDPVTEWLR